MAQTKTIAPAIKGCLTVASFGSWRNRRWQIARIFSAFIPWQRAEDRIEIAVPQHLRRGVSLAVSGNVLYELIDYLEADFLMRFLPATEAELDPHLHLIA